MSAAMISAIRKNRAKAAMLAAISLAVVPLTMAQDSTSEHFRLAGATPAAVAATAQSPVYQAQVAGGSGMPVGIAASENTTVVVGPGSAGPGDFLFGNGFE